MASVQQKAIQNRGSDLPNTPKNEIKVKSLLQFNYFRGGLLPRPPPDGLPVLLGAFSIFIAINFPLRPGILSESCEPGAPSERLKNLGCLT
jgi:hypothetical protein